MPSQVPKLCPVWHVFVGSSELPLWLDVPGSSCPQSGVPVQVVQLPGALEVQGILRHTTGVDCTHLHVMMSSTPHSSFTWCSHVACSFLIVSSMLQGLCIAVWQRWAADDIHSILPQHAHLLMHRSLGHHIHCLVPGRVCWQPGVSDRLVGDTGQSELADLCGGRNQSAFCIWWPCHASVSPAPPNCPSPVPHRPIT